MNISAPWNEKVLILDFGSQYSQLIARRVREAGVYSELVPCSMPYSRILEQKPSALVLSGGPSSVYAENAPKPDPRIFDAGIPLLGICYGAQLIASVLGGQVIPASDLSGREYGHSDATFSADSVLFRNLPKNGTVWMSHGDSVKTLPNGFHATASSKVCPFAAFENKNRKIYGLQFHPEVSHTEYGTQIITAFLKDAAQLKADWSMAGFRKKAVEEIRAQTAGSKALLALSGGVDSSVAAALMSEAIGKDLTCVFVDHGLLRANEADEVIRTFSRFPLNFIHVDAGKSFLKALKDVADPEAKRKIIGAMFIETFNEQAKKLSDTDILVQGTIYPDVIESGGGNGAAVIKSHHNVGGLPADTGFRKIIEPLRLLFKDEVRALGMELGLPASLVNRQPFPGPGLAIRIIGEVTAEKLKTLRQADLIFRTELEAAGVKNADQYFAVLTNIRSVGVMGDGRTYDLTVALRAVNTSDFMTATVTRIPYEVLERVSSRIVNEVSGVNRVVYDITAKPPATIEWE